MVQDDNNVRIGISLFLRDRNGTRQKEGLLAHSNPWHRPREAISGSIELKSVGSWTRRRQGTPAISGVSYFAVLKPGCP